MKPRPHCSFIFYFTLLLCVMYGNRLLSQRTLEITRERFSVKVFKLEINDDIHYKLYGDWFYRHSEIADLRDSVIFLKNDQKVVLSDVKALRLRKSGLSRAVGGPVLTAGILLFAISAINQASGHRSPVFEPTISYIAGGMALSSFIIYELGIKRFHNNRRTTFRIIDRDFGNLAPVSADSTKKN